ncbi:MAG: dCMP deaminase family protein [Clostridiales bacterium]|nr:dCMP deaminase family protein [Clostridiales bacterium]
MERVSKTNYYLDIAMTVAERSTCLRKCYGAIIVKNDTIISTGYNGAPRGRANCCDLGTCLREKLAIPRGERYELCRSVHSEANAIIAASREQMLGSTLYMACVDPRTREIIPGTTSCSMCKRFIINAGIERVIVRETANEYREYLVSDWVEQDDISDVSFGY